MSDEFSVSLTLAMDELIALDRSALVERWVVAFDCSAPRSIQVGLLRAALAWHWQMKHLKGETAKSTQQLLRRLQRSSARPAADPLAPGTRLLREWQGQPYHVTVRDQGFEYAGQRYRA